MPKLLSRINLPQYAAAPSSPAQGDMYYNTTDDNVYVYDGSQWIDLTLTSATTGATGYWGSFWSTQDQTAASANTAYSITLNNTDADSSGVSIVSNSRVTFSYSGVYSIIYSVQFVNTSNSIYDANIWLKKNGSNVADSDSKWSVVGSHGGVNGHAIGSVNYVLKVTAGDYLELAWQTTNTAVSIEADPAASPAPGIPSVILTATQVMNTQVGPTGPGVAAGGTTGQVLAKASGTNYDTQWVDAGSGSGDITAVIAGTGLTGGASSGSATLNVDTTTIATKTYVDEMATGLNWHGAVSAATAAVLPNSPTYTAGSADASSGYGVGAKLTATTYGLLTVDTFDLDTVGMRVLVKNQANQIHNGIYTVTVVGAVSTYWELTRAADSDNHIAGQVGAGDSVYCLEGTENAGQGFVLSSNGTYNEYVHILGTDALEWSQFTGIANIIAGTGLSKSGNTLNVGAGTAITVNADTIEVQLTDSTSSTSITTAATPASVKVAYDAAASAQSTANSGVSDAAAAQATANAAIPKSLVTAKGNIVAATGSGVPSALAAGSNNQILIANSAQATGLEWITAPYAPSASPTITGKIVVDNNAGSPVSLGSLNTQTAIQAVSADAIHTSIVVDAHGTGVHGSYIARATRGTAGSPTAVQSGDTVGSVIFTGYGSTGFVGGEPVAIRGIATENWTDSANGSKVDIILTTAGGTTAVTAVSATPSSLELPTGSALKIAGATVLSGSTLGSGVTASSLTSVGTIATGTWNGTPVGIAYGGTGATTAANAANAILPSQTGQSGKVLSTDGSALSWYSIDLSNLTIDGGSA